MPKFQQVFSNNATKKIAFLSRTINFLEDVLDDAECEAVYVDSSALEREEILVEGVNCVYDLEESIEVFSKQYSLDAEPANRADLSLRSLYEMVISTYKETLHYKMKEFASKTMINKIEYYLGILFNGKAFIVEGEEERIAIPGFKQCFAAHTHPSSIPVPSRPDLKSIINLFLDRGIGHVIETANTAMVIYRVAPLTDEDLEVLMSAVRFNDPMECLRIFSSRDSIKLVYI